MCLLTSRPLGDFNGCSIGSISIRVGFSSWTGWPKSGRSASHVAKMLNQFERMELIDSARACVLGHPRAA